MGQYHVIVNLTKRQFIKPHRFGDGSKLLEFGCSGCGTMTALACLLARDNGRGGGDLKTDDPIVGSWAGDQIVIVGDYGDKGVDSPEGTNLYMFCISELDDISTRIREAIRSDEYIAREMRGE